MPAETETTETTRILNDDLTFADGWKDHLEEDIRGAECLKLVHDLPGAIKQLVHAKRAVGNNIAVPGVDASEEEFNTFYGALGRPETPNDYKVEIADELKEIFTDERMKNARELAHKLGINQKQFEGFMGAEVERIGAEIAAKLERDDTAKSEVEANLRKEFGAAYDERMHAMNVLIAESFDDEDAKLAFLEKFGSDEDFIRWSNRIAGKMVEHKALVAKLTTDTPGDALEQIKTLQATDGYIDGRLKAKDPRAHLAIVNKIAELRKIAQPE